MAIETVTNAAGQDVFSRFYVCFEQLRTTWKETCKPLIGVDGCFLRGKMKGQLLVAFGRDANNQIYPVAWGCVQVENTENWVWFIKKIKEDLDLGDGDGYIIISDRQKGLIRALQMEIPNVEHRMCVRHIYANLKKKHGKKPFMKPLMDQMSIQPPTASMSGRPKNSAKDKRKKGVNESLTKKQHNNKRIMHFAYVRHLITTQDFTRTIKSSRIKSRAATTSRTKSRPANSSRIKSRAAHSTQSNR